MSIGRSRDNDVVIENLSVSRNHGRVRRQGNKFVLTDLNSANGTFVNGVRISKTEIMDGDVVTVGKHKLLFVNKTVTEEEVIMDAFAADRTVMVDRAESHVGVLCVIEGKLKGKEFTLQNNACYVGKAPGMDIVLADEWFLSRKQAVIARYGDEYTIEDLGGGMKKTRLNGKHVNRPTKLKPGDRLDFGSTGCIFKLGADASASAGRVPQELGLEDSIFSTGLSELQVVESSEPQQPTAPDATPYPFRQAAHADNSQEAAQDAEHMIDIDALAGIDLGAEEPSGELSEESFEEYEPEQELAPVGASEEDAYLDGEEQVVSKKKHRERQQAAAPAASVVPDDLNEMLGLPPFSDEAAIAVAETPVPSDDNQYYSRPTVNPEDMDDETRTREVALWEKALQNKSPLIRKKAAQELKKLTGIDYAH